MLFTVSDSRHSSKHHHIWLCHESSCYQGNVVLKLVFSWISYSLPTTSQAPRLPQELHLWHFPSQDSSSPSHGMSHHWAWVEQLIPTLSTSLAQMTCVGMLTHSWDLVIVHTATHVQGGHWLVRGTLSQCRQPTVVGAREDLRAALSLCAYRVCWDMFVVGMYLLDKNVVNKFIWLSSCWVSSSCCVYIF